MKHSFGFDSYINSITSQLNANFHKIDRAIAECRSQKDDDAHAVLKSSKLVECAHKDSYYRSIASLCVGIFGEWGSGKTKLLKGIENHYHEKETTIIPIFFNAWRYEKDEHIIIPLFKTLLHEIKQLDEKDEGGTTFKNLLRDMRILTFSILSGFEAEAFGVKFSANDAISRLFEMQDDTDKKGDIDELELMERIESVYFNIPQKIEAITLEHDVRFVFLIDDLDRCLPENTLKMLESIKLFLDIPGCAFVMAIDDDIVERGVEHHYKNYITQEIHIDKNQTSISSDTSTKNIPITGSEYLEKMIQLPFSLPVLTSQDIREFLLTQYKDVFKKKQEHDKTHSEKEQKPEIDEEFLTLFTQIIPPVPRKMIRTIELFKLKDALITIEKSELLKLVALELFAPSLFRLTKQKFPKQNVLEILNNWIEKANIYHFEDIQNDIIEDTGLTEPIKRLFSDILTALKKEDLSRVKFDMEAVFSRAIYEDDIERYLHLDDKLYRYSFKANKLKPLSSTKRDELTKALQSKDPQIWTIALKELEGNTLSSEDITAIIESDIDITNAWLEKIEPHVDKDDFIRLVVSSKLLDKVKR